MEKMTKKPNSLWRGYFHLCVALARRAGYDTMNLGRLTPTQEKWVKEQGHFVTEACQASHWPDHHISTTRK